MKGKKHIFCKSLQLYTITNLYAVLEKNYCEFYYELKSLAKNIFLSLNLTVLLNSFNF